MGGIGAGIVGNVLSMFTLRGAMAIPVPCTADVGCENPYS
ncbi:Unknown protein sequence [Pseudomonas coronafaciens pv. oryzae]|nr:Unknown protein sequence [Pseudomonas coronafaciens pv. oryzae]